MKFTLLSIIVAAAFCINKCKLEYEPIEETLKPRQFISFRRIAYSIDEATKHVELLRTLNAVKELAPFFPIFVDCYIEFFKDAGTFFGVFERRENAEYIDATTFFEGFQRISDDSARAAIYANIVRAVQTIENFGFILYTEFDSLYFRNAAFTEPVFLPLPGDIFFNGPTVINNELVESPLILYKTAFYREAIQRVRSSNPKYTFAYSVGKTILDLEYCFAAQCELNYIRYRLHTVAVPFAHFNSRDDFVFGPNRRNSLLPETLFGKGGLYYTEKPTKTLKALTDYLSHGAAPTGDFDALLARVATKRVSPVLPRRRQSRSRSRSRSSKRGGSPK